MPFSNWTNRPLTVALLGMLLLCTLDMAPMVRAAGTSDVSTGVETKGHALVVGVGDYEHWPSLTDAIGNARLFAHALKQEGFAVDLLTNPRSKAFKAALHQLVADSKVSRDQRSLVYFAGHSETEIRTDGTQLGWLIPADCPSLAADSDQFRKHAVGIRDLMDILMDLESRQVLTLLDTAVDEDRLPTSTPRLNLLGIKYKQPVRQFIVAGHMGAPLTDGRVFMQHVLEGLRGGADTVRDGKITGSELAVYLQQEVSRSTQGKQHPQFAATGLPGLPKGDFTFDIFQKHAVPGWLTVKTSPPDAMIRILNIKPKFEQGMALEPGRYLVEVRAENHFKWRDWTTIDAGQNHMLDVTLKQAEIAITNVLGMTLNLIRRGRFKMGSPESESFRHTDETLHDIDLTEGFYMQTTEVTQGQFARFVKDAGYTTTAEISKPCWFCNDRGEWKPSETLHWQTKNKTADAPDPKSAGLPVTCVSWKDAQAFTDWLSRKEKRTYRLPTEAQWEYACRAGSGKAFAFGQCLSSAQANFSGVGNYVVACKPDKKKQSGRLLPVASFAPNAWGLFDMHGNAAEWCLDWYGPYAERRAANPMGAESGAEKIVRGGHLRSYIVDCRAARRSKLRPDFSSKAVGFRVVMITDSPK